MENTNGNRVRKPQGLAGMRRSCDACGRKKKRCDGEQPCSRCVRTESDCQYSKRRWHHPEFCKIRQTRQPKPNDGDLIMSARGHLVHSTPSVPVECRMLPFKRCRLSASPATGLVGMQENAFLSDFFGCNGFLPLTDESQIREAVVKIMVPDSPRQQGGVTTDYCGEEGHFGPRHVASTFGNFCRTKNLPKDPSFCTFWCAVAVGALAKGSPIESVEKYSELAGEALEASRPGSTAADLAKASASLTYLYSFMGAVGKFKESLKLSKHFLRASVEQGSADLQVGLPDLIQHCQKIGDVQNESMDSFWADGEASPQWDELATEGDLYRAVAQSFRAFDRAVYDKARERYADDLDDLASGGPSNGSSEVSDTLPWEVSEAIAAVLGRDNAVEFGRLQETADRPSVRAGVGGLLINGALVFEKAAKGDLHSTLERLDRTLEVYERYPGMCRCMMGSHLSHMLLTILVAVGDYRARGMYDRLRGTYNSCRASYSRAIPPLEEWQGMGAICGDLHCRAMETLIKSEHMKALTTRSDKSTRDSPDLVQAARNRSGQTNDGNEQASFVRGESVDLVPFYPLSSSAESNATSKDQLGQHPAALALSARAFGSISQSDMVGFDSDCGKTICWGRDPMPPSMSGRLDGFQGDTIESEGEEIAPADWLEVTYALLDTVHAP